MKNKLKIIVLASAITLLTPSCAPFISYKYITLEQCIPKKYLDNEENSEDDSKIEKTYTEQDSIRIEKEKQMDYNFKRIKYSDPDALRINFKIMNFD